VNAMPTLGGSSAIVRPLAELDTSDTAALAKANVEAGFKRLTTFQAVTTFMSMTWLGAGGKVLTADLQANLKDNCINVGVVAALIFTMVSMDPGSVGDSLVDLSNNTITKEACDATFACLSSVSQWFLFGAVLHSLYMYCQLSELNGVRETKVWSRYMGDLLTNAHFLYLIVGFVFYIISEIFLALTIMPLAAFAASLGTLLLAVALPLLAFSVRGVQGIYEAKVVVAEEHRQSGGGGGVVAGSL